MDNYLKFVEYREAYPSFIYDGFEYSVNQDVLKVQYNFEISSLAKFNPTWEFKISEDFNIKQNKNLIENCIFNIGMVELLSYWKATCSPKIIVKCAKLTDTQISWWKKLYINGLGEFFYYNQIFEHLNYVNDYTVLTDKKEELLNIECQSNVEYKAENINLNLCGNLIPVGGGKDSVVTMEIMCSMKYENMVYIVNPRGASKTTANIAGYDTFYAPKRILDSNLFKLNETGFLNGHTPFSAMLAFSAYLSAIITGKKYILLSNESSANEPSVSGTKVNHQYSKSFEFEQDVRQYFHKYIADNGPEYYSLLRPLNEWQIAKIFANYPKYFENFKSCNVGSRQDIWCEKCAKCLYVYILLAAFLKKENLNKIFKTDMLDNIALKEIFDGLVYENINKPFECVGTKDEVNLCLNMIIRKHYKDNKTLPALLKEYKLLNDDAYNILLDKIANSWNEENNVIYEHEELIRRCLER